MINKLIIPFIVACILFTGCDTDDDSPKRMIWTAVNESPEDIRLDNSVGNDGITQVSIDVNYKGGALVLTCENIEKLNPIRNDSYVWDFGWGVVAVSGRTMLCHFPVDASGREEASEQITVSANAGGVVLNTVITITRTFGELMPPPEDVPDKYKFKLVSAGLMPFMNDDFTVPAPFDNVSYRITNYYDSYQALGFPEYTQYYDSIVWCADGFPDTVRIYERKGGHGSAEEHFTSQWSTHFFRSGEIKNHLKGYRDGEVLYSASHTTYLYERGFLCYDWVKGSVILLNPANTGVYCRLDSKYEYQAVHTQEISGTRYGKINVWNKNATPEADFLSVEQEALMKLMTDNVGQAQEASDRVGLFCCLHEEGNEALKFWENKTTRILLMHKLPDENGFEKYYLHFEAK